MRINEIINYEESLKLWQIINNTVFTVLTQQAKQVDDQQTTTNNLVKIDPNANAARPYLINPTVNPVAKPGASPQQNQFSKRLSSSR